MFRYLVSLCFLLLSMSPARACWDTPDHACFTGLWTDKALAHAAGGPQVARLYDLILWDTVPPGEAAARSLIEELSYEDLVAHHAAEAKEAGNPMMDMLAPNGTEQPSLDLALLLMLGHLNPPDHTHSPTENLLPLYDIARQTGVPDLEALWYSHLPPHLQAERAHLAPDGSLLYPDRSAEARAYTIATLTHLRAGETDKALSSAAQTAGEPAFLAWRAIANHAIARDDMGLLADAVDGMRASLDTAIPTEFDEQAVEAAKAELAATGDPDALAYVYESFDPSTNELPTVVHLTTALAARYLNTQLGQTNDDGFDAAMRVVADAMQSGFEQDTAALMRNAQAALRLGLEAEADQIIRLAFDHDLGVPPFELYNMPIEATPWAEDWVGRMQARYDGIIADPEPFESREYWSIWVDQDALSDAIEITRLLTFYDYRDEAQAFADRASAYLATLPKRYPNLTGFDQATLFDGETAALLYPPDVAIPRMRQGGMDDLLIAYAMADAKRPDIALMVLETPDGQRNLSHWMAYTDEVPDWQRAEYIALLRPLIDDEADRLIRDGYAQLAQDIYAKAAVFLAGQQDWPAARGYYQRLEDVEVQHGIVYATRNRLITLRDIARRLSNDPPQISYPYDDFAL